MARDKLLLIGAGQLGSRHLQGIAKSRLPVSVTVVEPDLSRIGIARERLNEVILGYNDEDYRFCQSLREITSEKFRLAIIATNADVRPAVLNTLIDVAETENIILEKVVFQSEDLFPEMIDKFRNRKINVWVNCPRRIFPIYRELRGLLKNEESLSLYVTGGNWGLACNALHFIDLFAFLSDIVEIFTDVSNLDAGILQSKRAGFIEVTGFLSFRNKKGLLVLESARDCSLPTLIKIISPKYEIIVNEAAGKYSVSEKDSRANFQENYFKMLYQSEMTGIIAEKILNGEDPGLVTIESSFVQHSALLPVLTRHISKIQGVDHLVCPIT
jgi:hypothetical protein